MDVDYQIVFVDKPDDAIWTAIGGGINTFNELPDFPAGHNRFFMTKSL